MVSRESVKISLKFQEVFYLLYHQTWRWDDVSSGVKYLTLGQERVHILDF